VNETKFQVLQLKKKFLPVNSFMFSMLYFTLDGPGAYELPKAAKKHKIYATCHHNPNLRLITAK